MIVDILLAFIFLTSFAFAARMMFRKLPILLLVPAELITQSFVTRPSRLKHYGGPVVDFFRNGTRAMLLRLLISLLSRVRLWLMRSERMTFKMLESIQERSRRLAGGGGEYWSELKQWKSDGRETGSAVPTSVREAKPEVVTKTVDVVLMGPLQAEKKHANRPRQPRVKKVETSIEI